MKEKIKEFLEKYLIGFIFGFVSVGIVAVYAETYFPSNDVTYDNKESGLVSTDVQGAIDELYGVCFPKPAGEQIIEDAGLEKDPYECRYFFTGANPNNYITFNDEKAGWRIISVECDGTIKIIRDMNKDILEKQWNSYNGNNWAEPASLNTYLNETYYNGLNATAKNQIVSKEWSIGAVTENNNDLEEQIKEENSNKWTGKIALPTVSEYLRANNNKGSCGTLSLNNNSSGCLTTNWMDNDVTNSIGYAWTISISMNDNYSTFAISYNGGVYLYDAYQAYRGVRPTLYLSSEVSLTGSGTQTDPYVVQ